MARPVSDSVSPVSGGLTPEQKARVEIDKLLVAAGWLVQDFGDMDLTAARGVAIREFPLEGGFADYLLYGDKKALGTIEAKKVGELLFGVEKQSDDYAEGFTKRAKKK